MDTKKAGLLLIPVYLALQVWISMISYRSEVLFFILVFAVFAVYFAGVKFRVRYPLALALLLIIGSRFPYFFNLPQLSDDFYRFLWDGMLLNEGLNPIGKIPSEQIINNLQNPGFGELLLQQMNSPGYTSVYPPFHQFFFGISYFLAGPDLLRGVNVMRALMLSIELLTFLVLLLRRSSREQNYFFAYLVNPLIVIEGIGNLHFEAVLLPFVAIALIDFSRKWHLRSSIPLAGSILIKLRSAILIPVFLFRFAPRRRLLFLISLAVTIFIFIGMFDRTRYFLNMDKGIGLYFQSFEFNASVYYLLNSIIALIIGYNPIAILAPVLAVICAALILMVTYRYRYANIFEVSLVVYLIFLLLATTVHPWYVIPTVYLAIRSGRQYLLVWSMLVFLSYSRYWGDGEPKWIFILIEYLGLIASILLEGYRRPWLQPALRG